jgi:Holliday junction resolvasome RuvABC endonuclease subunit
MSIFVGVDQSFSCTGYFIVDNDNNILEFGTKSAKKSDDVDIFDRSWSVAQQLVSVIKNYEKPIICIEGLSFGQIGSATRDLAGLQHTIINVLRELHNIRDITIVPPTTLKKHALGKGKGSKQEMVESLPSNVLDVLISNKYKKSNGLYDLADAFWLSQYIRTHKLKESA